jgi:hypothetical protein
MDKRERLGAQDALVNWFSSQSISPPDACFIMASLIGDLVGRLSRQDLASRGEALKIFQREMIRQANDD